ncbi:MAG: PilZ domain-containing protein [Desulfobulbaceae bacterium]
MDNDSAESRRHRRIYFPGELVVSGIVAGSDAQTGLPVKILNLSEGGLFFTIAKENGSHFQENARVLFMGMKGPDPFNLSQKMHMTIRWVFSDAALESIGYGCEFIDPPAQCVDLLRNMVAGFFLDTAR